MCTAEPGTATPAPGPGDNPNRGDNPNAGDNPNPGDNPAGDNVGGPVTNNNVQIGGIFVPLPGQQARELDFGVTSPGSTATMKLTISLDPANDAEGPVTVTVTVTDPNDVFKLSDNGCKAVKLRAELNGPSCTLELTAKPKSNQKYTGTVRFKLSKGGQDSLALIVIGG